MTVLNTGSTKAFSAGWSNIFSGKKSSGAAAAKSAAAEKKPAKKKPAKSIKAKKKAKK